MAIFERKTNGDALKSLADTISCLTYDEMLAFARGVGGVDSAQKINEWAKNYLNPPTPPADPASQPAVQN